MTNSLLPGWLGEGFSLWWKFVFLFMDLLEDWLPAGCGGWLGRLGACLGLGLGGACRVGWLAVAWRVGMRRAIQKVEQKMIAALALFECDWCRFQD